MVTVVAEIQRNIFRSVEYLILIGVLSIDHSFLPRLSLKKLPSSYQCIRNESLVVVVVVVVVVEQQ